MVIAESETDTPRLYYRAIPGRAVRTDVANYASTYQQELDSNVTELVDFLAREWSPENQLVGLGLTYSEVVGALHEFYKAGALTSAFATERDMLIADLLASSNGDQIEVRPETPGARSELVVFNEKNLKPSQKTGEERQGGLLETIDRGPPTKK